MSNEDQEMLEGMKEGFAIRLAAVERERDDLQAIVDHHDMIQFSNSHEFVRRGYEQLLSAIKEHHSQKADDRCIEDDYKLYNAAGLPPHDPHVGDKAAMMKNCVRFIENRCKSGKWPSYAELEAKLKSLQETEEACERLRCWYVAILSDYIKLEYEAQMVLGNWTSQTQRDQLRKQLNEVKRRHDERKNLPKVQGERNPEKEGSGKACGDSVPVPEVQRLGRPIPPNGIAYG